MNLILEIKNILCLETSLCALVIGMLAASLFSNISNRRFYHLLIALLSTIFIAHILIIYLFSGAKTGLYLSGAVILDPFSYFMKSFFVLSAIFILIMSRDYMDQLDRGQKEFGLLILLALLGMCLVTSSNDLILLFVSIELITVSFYVMTAYIRTDAKSIEAGLKYLVLGALSTGFLLYGMSFIFGATGSIYLNVIANYFHENSISQIALLGILLVFVGVAFKIASFPFQFWVPDVYEGAPIPVTAFLSVGSKAAGITILVRLIVITLPDLEQKWEAILAVLSAITLFYGNLGAIPQKNIKRFLGYSSIGHAGYLLMGLTTSSILGISGVLYYLVSYLFTNLGIFLIIHIFTKNPSHDTIDAYSGLSQRSPFLAAAFLIFLMSLAGIPPLSGFFGKFLVIASVVKGKLLWLAVIGGINIVISMYYYLVIVRKIYISPPNELDPIVIPRLSQWAVGVSIAAVLFLGIFQNPLLCVAQAIAKSLLRI